MAVIAATKVGSIIAVTAVLTAAVMALGFILLYQFRVRRRISRLLGVISQVSGESTEVRAVLAALDIGVIAYGSNDRLLTMNRMAANLLPEIPETLSDFFSLYGEDNGMKASMFLGSSTLVGTIPTGGRTLVVTVQRLSLIHI